MILSFDASTQRGSVALVHGPQVLRELFIETPRGRGGALFSALEEILGNAPSVERVVVGVGPGSYNGVRSAIAAAWGIALARQVPLVGISSILGLDEGSYCAIGDARRGQYFFAQVRDGNFVTEPKLVAKDQLEGTLRETPLLPVFASAPVAFLRDVTVRAPSAARLAVLAANWAPNRPQPMYLKEAHVTKPRGARL